MIDADYADDRALPANTPAQAKSQLHSLEQTAGVIILYVNANKTEFIWFWTRSNFYEVASLQPVHIPRQQRLIYWKRYQTIRSESVWTAINWLSVIWKTHLFDKSKRDFYSAVWFGLVWCVGLYGISAFVGHLTPNSSLYK